MGKIPTYQRDRFMSTYVGEPQLDTSGIQAVEGLTNAGTAVVNIEAQKMEERAKVAVDMQAQNALLDYSLAYGRKIKELEKTYADDPGKFPEAVASEGSKLQAEYTKNIKDERVAARFGGAANTLIRQSGTGALQWTEVKQEENANASWQGSLNTLVQTAASETTIEGFTRTLGQISSTAGSYTLGTPELRKSARETKLDEATRAYMSAQLDNDARSFWNAIDSGKYDELEFEDNGVKYAVPLSPKLKAEYKDLAEKKALTQQSEKQIQMALRVTGDLEELALAVNSGEKGLKDLMYKRDQIYAQGSADGGEPATQEAKDNIDSLIKLEVSTKSKSGKLDPYTLDDINAQWLLLSEEIKENADNPENLTTKLLKLNTQINNAFAEGKITQPEWTTAHRKLSLPLMQSIQSQAGQRTGFITARRYSDPLGGAYKKIGAAVGNMTINDDRKLRTRVNAFSFFMDSVTEAEDKGKTLTDEEYDVMATQALRKAQAVYFSNVGEPEEKVVTINGVTLRYVGLNANGVADYAPDGAIQSAAKIKR